MSTQSSLNPFLLAANTPEPDPRLLPLLRSQPSRASQQDAHGYSLLHAAASYNHVELLRLLVQELKVDVNLIDEDNETCLFVAETVEVARTLVEELHIDTTLQNEDGMTALEKFESEQEFPEVAAYLRSCATGGSRTATTSDEVEAQRAPQLPPNVAITVGTGDGGDINGEAPEPDPEFRRRIEELASRENFHTPEGQQELRDLITDAVRDVSSDDREVRRRVG